MNSERFDDLLEQERWMRLLVRKYGYRKGMAVWDNACMRGDTLTWAVRVNRAMEYHRRLPR